MIGDQLMDGIGTGDVSVNSGFQCVRAIIFLKDESINGNE